MAGQIPQPRSYQQILGDMIDAFLSRYGLRGLRTGGPLLSLLEASAQSDLRSTQDIFNFLDSIDIDRATGIALDRKAEDDDIVRLPVAPSSGYVTISDTSFVKIVSKIYPGASAPNAGTTSLKVSDASSFPATGSVYIGRDTTNYEGPIAYTATASLGTYWTLALATATQKFHDVNEEVVLAQGGNRTVSAGTVVSTVSAAATDPVEFATLNTVTILDGETEVEGVDVLCQQPGVIGNVPHDAIREFSSEPFTGAAVVNPLPIDNGQAAEDDAALRERIKAARQSRARGTPLALITNAKGVQATDENKTVVSASVFSAQGEPTVLFIDDGTGYEQIQEGVALETLVDQALGGEQYFKLIGGTPVAKAFALTTLSTPFALVAGAKLAVNVAGVLTEHSFSESEFRSISNATAYEIVAAINGNPDLLFSARTSNNGNEIAIFARSETNEDIEVVTPDSGINANTYLGFPSGINYTLKLYKDDRLLYKDGKSAVVVSAPQTNWSSTLGTNTYVKVKVDTTPAIIYKITNQDFIDAATGYTTVSALNSLESWATVLNNKIPGITATAAAGRLQIISNRDASSNAAIIISEPVTGEKDVDGVTLDGTSGKDPDVNLIKKGVFTTTSGLTAAGRSNDYTLNRNTGELKLAVPLEEDEALSAGTEYTRAYLQSSEISSATVTITSGAKLYFVVDGAAAAVTTGITSGTTFNLTAPAGNRRRYATSPGVAAFANLRVGDWAIIWDPIFTVKGAWRVSGVDGAYEWFEVERETTHADQTGVAPSSNGMIFVRSAAPVQEVSITAGTNIPLTTISTEINSGLAGATASVFQNTKLRVTTDTFALTGDIFLATADVQGQKLLLTRSSLVTNHTSHLPAVESANTESGTPSFLTGAVSAVGASGVTFTVTGPTITTDDVVRFLNKIPSSSLGHGNLVGQWTTVSGVSAGVVTPPVAMPTALVGDRVIQTSHFGIGPEDTLNLILDTNSVTKNYSLPMYRKIKPVAGQSYTATALQILDVDNGNVAPSVAFGSSVTNFFKEFALFMKARGKSHSSSGGSAPANYHYNKALLWRYGRLGPEGNRVRISYVNPTAPSQAISMTTTNGQYADIQIRLPSDVARTGTSLFDTTKFLVTRTATASPADTYTWTYSKPTVSLQRVSNVVTATAGVAHGFVVGDVVYITSGDVSFPSGPKTVTAISGGSPGLETIFTYAETAADAGPSGGQSASSASADPSFANVQVGDIAYVASGTGFGSTHKGAWRVTAKTATTFSARRLTGSDMSDAGPESINLASNLQFYPIKSADSTATLIAAWITANAGGFVSAVAVENGGGAPGTGTIDMATLDEYLASYGNSAGGTSVQTWSLADGINYVASSVLGSVPNTITLKNAITSDLVSNSDFNNEEMRLVPVTTDEISRFITSPAVSGFYAGSQVVASSRAQKLQLSSTTSGSSGAIQVTGGTANSATATIAGSGSVVDTSYSKVTIPTTQARGLFGNQWVAVQGSHVQQKTTALSTSSTLAVAANGDNWTVTASVNLRTLRQAITDTADYWQIDSVGDFACYTLIDNGSANTLSGSIEEGDWVVIDLSEASPANTGTFRVVRRASTTQFWVENPDAVNEQVDVVTDDAVSFFSYDSAMPGDTLVIDSNVLGADNRGTFTIVEHGTLATQIVVSGEMVAVSATTLSTNVSFIRILEAEPIRLIKKIHTIGRSTSSADFLDVVFDTEEQATRMSSGAGCSILPLDKLAFPTDLVAGADAYSYATGLIGEVSRVMYGDPANPTVYPGVVAAGALVNVSGPLVKRIQLGLAIRIRTGATASDIVERVKSAVASAINRVPIGNSVAISTLVASAAAVEGVVAVTVLSPDYSAGNDLIAVQANEKPRILDVDQDILVSVVGQ